MIGSDDNAWTYSQVVALFDLAAKNIPVPVIARSLSKSEAAVRNKAFAMGLTVKPGNSFYSAVKDSGRNEGT